MWRARLRCVWLAMVSAALQSGAGALGQARNPRALLYDARHTTLLGDATSGVSSRHEPRAGQGFGRGLVHPSEVAAAFAL
eukprot:3630894-Amphidinium_carterae.4